MRMANGKVKLFDFGGQIEYAVTHQFFLSNKVGHHFIIVILIVNNNTLDGTLPCLL